jgi:hypothetical protein
VFQSLFFSESRSFTRPLFCFFVPDLDGYAGQPIQIFLFCSFCSRSGSRFLRRRTYKNKRHTRGDAHTRTPWTPIQKPEEVVADALVVYPITEMKSSLRSSRGISPRAWRHGGRLPLRIRERLTSLLFAEGRTFMTTGTKSYATACRSRQVCQEH